MVPHWSLICHCCKPCSLTRAPGWMDRCECSRFLEDDGSVKESNPSFLVIWIRPCLNLETSYWLPGNELWVLHAKTPMKIGETRSNLKMFKTITKSQFLSISHGRINIDHRAILLLEAIIFSSLAWSSTCLGLKSTVFQRESALAATAKPKTGKVLLLRSQWSRILPMVRFNCFQELMLKGVEIHDKPKKWSSMWILEWGPEASLGVSSPWYQREILGTHGRLP